MSTLVRAIASPFRLFGAVREEIAKERRLRLSDGMGWALAFGRESSSGKIVTLDNAMQLATVWACIKLTAQAVSSLPLHFYEKSDDGDRRRVDDDIAAVVGSDGSPNEDQTPLEFWEGIVAWLMTTGNAYAEKVYTGRTLSALQPIMSTHCRPVRNADGTLVYRVTDRGKSEDLPRDKIFHVKGFGQGLKNPDEGLSPIAAGTNSLGAAMAAQDAAGRTFANGMRPTGILTIDQVLKPDQREQLKNNIVAPMVGASNSGGIFTLEAGMKFQPITLNPDDAQMLETRRFDVEEICRWFGVPPIIIGHAAQGQTMWGTGVESILIAWLTLGIDPVCDRIEARIKKQLIRPTGNRRRYAEFNREALLQMDSTAKAAFLSQMVNNGLMSRNEGRAKLNLRRSDDQNADKLTVQSAMVPLDALGQEAEGSQARAAFMNWLGLSKEREDEQE